MNIQEFRKQFPEYNGLADSDLADSLYNKFYSGKMPKKEFERQFLGEIKVTPKKKGLLSGFERIGEIYKEEVASGQQAMQEMVDKPGGKTFIKGVLGAAQYGLAPMTALSKGAIREPVESIPRALGAPEPVSRFIGETAEQVPYFLPYGKLVKEAISAKELLKTSEIQPEIVESIKMLGKEATPTPPTTKLPLKYPSEPTEKLAAELAAEGKLSKPVVQETIQQKVADAATKILETSPPQERQRVGQKIIDLIHSDQFNWQELPEILKRYNITPQEFAQRLKDTYSEAGRSLGRLSVVARRVQRLFKNNPEAYEFFNKVAKSLPDPTPFDKVMNSLYSLESTRRGLLVTQLATAARNALSQSMRVTIGAIDESLQGAIRATVGGQGNTLQQIGEGLDMTKALLGRFRKSDRVRLTQILQSENADFARVKLLGTPVHEVALGSKVANLFNTVNRFQEFFFRKIAFESKLSQLLERRGFNLKNIDPNKIPQQSLEEATQYALEMTFASMPKSAAGKKLVQQWAGNPLMTALLNPFPRFNFGNALPFIGNFSPVSFMRALNPKVVADLATGNPERFAQLASKATIGSTMLGAAVYQRMQSDGTDKYYEIKVGKRYVDTRSYAPLVSPYLLVAEAMIRPEKLSAGDWVQVAVGLNRIAGTGLVATDLIRSKKIESAGQVIARLTGEYLGSFSVPARTFQDLYVLVNPEAAKYRDVRENPITGPFQRNIPVLGQELPVAESPIDTMKIEPPIKVAGIEIPIAVFRQITGLTLKTKNIIEAEVDRLAIDPSRVYPKTGVPKADRMLSKYMAPIMERIAPVLIENPRYESLTRPMKRLAMAELFRQGRQAARAVLARENPDLFLKIRYEGLKDDIQEILESKGFIKPK